MKILLLVEDIAKISQLLRQDSSIKVIDEYELTESTSYTGGINQVGYSDYIINRAINLSKIYKFNKTLCIVLDQRHKNSVDKIPHDVSIRVCKSLVPRRLGNSFTQQVDKIYLEDEFTLDGLVA
jgi:hypothetical protein